jgi:hypothetical protein
MKREIAIGLLVLCAALLCAQPSEAQMFSLWSDENMTCCDVFPTGPYQPFHVFVFLDPGPDGAFAAEYKLETITGHFSPGGSVIAPFVSSATIGVWYGSPGISAPFTSCQTELVWIIDLVMMAPNVDPGYYTIELNESSNFCGVAICPGSRPLADAGVYNVFGYNTSCSA